MSKRIFDLKEFTLKDQQVNIDKNILHQSKTLIEHAYSMMRSDIVNGNLHANEKLRVAHLQKKYCVSASTLREAISRLVSEYLVSAEGQKGYYVTPMTLDDLIDLTQLRIHIEINALRQSIRKGSLEWRNKLTIVFKQLSKLEQPINDNNPHEWDLLNAQFHQTLCDGEKSMWTRRMLRLLSQHGERYRHFTIKLPNNDRDIHSEHDEIFMNAINGNEVRAALALEAHIRSTEKQIILEAQKGNICFS
jgi:DNA-binding GntR family transcriptional regulator